MAAAGGNPHKVILVGENHGDDLGKPLTKVFGEFVSGTTQREYGYTDVSSFVIYYETVADYLKVSFKYRNQPVTRPLLPLEELSGVPSISRKNIFDSVMPESVPSAMSSNYYLLHALTELMIYYLDHERFDAVVSSGADGVSAIETVFNDISNRFPDVLANIKPDEQFGQFRKRMTELFPTEESLEMCITSYDEPECMERFIDLYEITRQYFDSFKTFHAQYAHIAFLTQPVTLMDDKQIELIARERAYTELSDRLLEQLESERDELMVRKLKSSIDASIAGGGNPRQISVVVVGNNHFVNMKRLLSIPPFEVIFQADTRVKPRKGALVKIQGLQSRPDLNGQYGIVTGATNSDGRTPVYCDVGKQPLGLLRDKFEVKEKTPNDAALEELFGPEQYSHIKSLLLGGGSKRYKKSSKRRCYARTRKGKRSKRRSAKKY